MEFIGYIVLAVLCTFILPTVAAVQLYIGGITLMACDTNGKVALWGIGFLLGLGLWCYAAFGTLLLWRIGLGL